MIRAAWLPAMAVLLLAFQNCGPAFETSAGVFTSEGRLVTDSPVLAPVIEKSFIYAGTAGRIHAYSLDHSTDALTSLGETPTPGRTPGWFTFDAESKKVFACDASGGNLDVMAHETSGALTIEQTLPFLGSSVHLSMSKTNTGYQFYGSSYNAGEFAGYSVDLFTAASSLTSSFTYSATAHTHSSSVDERRNLVFVANKDEERVVVYSRAGAQLTYLKEIPVGDPRIVLYDEKYDLLYVTTEANTGASEVKIYSIVSSGTDYLFGEVGNFSMGLRGSDLKLDHSHGYLVTTVRELGAEGLWALPLTTTGTFDSGRPSVFVPIAELEPRSLQLSPDGKYYVVTTNNPNNTADIIVFKIDYDANGAMTSQTRIHGIDLGAVSSPSNFMISRYK